MSWEELERAELPDDIREVKQKREDLDRLTARVLSTEDGLALMAWLKQMYVDVPVAVPGTDPSHAYYAEGQRSVVRDMEARINRARSL